MDVMPNNHDNMKHVEGVCVHISRRGFVSCGVWQRLKRPHLFMYIKWVFRLELTWQDRRPKHPTCSHTLCWGAILLLSLLLVPFYTVPLRTGSVSHSEALVSLGNRLAAWFSNVLHPYLPSSLQCPQSLLFSVHLPLGLHSYLQASLFF